eukprot:TRINITY_DN18154_c0_g1_i1.p2 TRINITY_DN18154_c0_g1~~TRINITY_DN18154_c0_g1_i1.p2  ORF type:complete len:129 (-),score=43.37 TRINITY_DN18154_c0_g1_i1:39-425(-)
MAEVVANPMDKLVYADNPNHGGGGDNAQNKPVEGPAKEHVEPAREFQASDLKDGAEKNQESEAITQDGHLHHVDGKVEHKDLANVDHKHHHKPENKEGSQPETQESNEQSQHAHDRQVKAQIHKADGN